MPELAVSKKTSEPAASSRPSEWLGPLFPFARNWGPLSAMREMSEEMDRMFRGLSSGTGAEAWTPSMDIQRCNGTLTVSAELPGLKKEEIKVEVSEDKLVIEGERKQEHKEDHDGYHRWERSYGKFYRSLPLPEGAKTDQVKAELKDGILKVSIPVAETAKRARQIPVSS